MRRRNEIAGPMGNRLSESEALHIWRCALVDVIRGAAPDLSVRQMAVLLSVYLTPPPHTVRGLASKLNMSKPAVTRALDKLGDLRFLRRKVDRKARRSVLIHRTPRGTVFLSEFAHLITDAAETLNRDG